MGCCSSNPEDNINDIDLSNQGLKEVPKPILSKKWLRKLNLSSNQISSFDDKFSKYN